MRAARRVVLLVVLWLLAWGDFSVANLVSGVVVAVALLLSCPSAPRTSDSTRLDVLGALRLGAYVVTQLVLSNLVMTRAILLYRSAAQPGVLAHVLHQPSEEVVTVMTSIIALSPGTMTVDVDRASSTIYVHFFRLTDIDAARSALDRLERLVVGAISAVPAPFLEPPKETP